MRAAVAIGLAISLCAVPLRAGAEDAHRDAPGPRLVLGGLAVGAMGFLAGFQLGEGASDDDDQSLGDLDSGYRVGSALGALALGLGVHLADHGRGDLVPTLVSSLLVGAAGVGLVYATDVEGLMIPTVLMQLVAAVHTERRTARSRREPTVRLGLWRAPPGAPGLTCHISF